MIQGPSRRIFWKSNCGRGISLRIAIDEQCRLFRGSQASRQVYRGGCLSNPTLLICDSNNPRQKSPKSRKVSRIAERMQLVSRGTSARCGFRTRTFHVEQPPVQWIPCLFHVPRGTIAPAASPATLFHVEHPPRNQSTGNRWLQFRPAIVSRGTLTRGPVLVLPS